MDRPDETSGSSAAPPQALFGVLEAQSAPPQAPDTFDRGPPPRPLPARAFVEIVQPPVSDGDSAKSASPATELADLAEVAAPHLSELPVAETNGPAADPLSADAAFSAIDAEASSRSLSAAELASAGATLQEIKPHRPIEISQVRLPDGAPAKDDDLGETIPQRMLEPRLWAPPPPPAFDGLVIDRSMRPDLAQPKEEKPRVSSDYGSLIKRGAKVFAWIAAGWLALVLLLILAYRFVNPPVSALMVQQWLTGQSVAQKWVSIEEMSPNVVRAVLLSEDGRFCDHFGIDLEAIEDAIENSDGRSRGGSTISMQVIKNLFLWPSKSYLRKAVEVPLTYVMEVVWPKRRIMEVYLNIAEWGPDIFGIGMAAQFHFNKAAKNLSEREAARLAVALPNPLVRNAGKPGAGLQRLANAIQVRMRLAPSSQLSCVLPKRRI
ncbi:MAG TPA: monofunctional biosynthetic peptidoglycan transglycosylase [Hyphomicrobium sp.]